MTLDAATLSQVICNIYDAAVEPTVWPKAMQSSCEFIGGLQAVMFWHDAAVQDANAEILGISGATVKTHLNRIYRKCGASNQGDLIKLIAGIGR